MCMVDSGGGLGSSSFFFFNSIRGAGGETGECPLPKPLVYAELSL